ncbi:hypothetical protein OBBRIDRAFT_751689 [Obba rivulosa]|uniref:CRA domain-containing protein n=1 Tax=Obba rivulosa TaxID=1052685 RepID=A0A8E2DMJ2_9APHY|nr:hypothetical protein OBBRIDRAFT_751689 [Obba rivulosa]
MQPSSSKDKGRATHRLFEPSPDDLRLIVLDHLCHNSFTNTARAFARETSVKHLDADGDEIMPPSESGGSGGTVSRRVDDEYPDLEPRLMAGEMRRAIRMHLLSGRIDDATALLNNYFPSVLSAHSTAPPPPTSPDKLPYLPATSVDPVHLALNLRIQAFIESARTVPLPYPPTPSADDDAEMHTLFRTANTDESNAELLRRAHGLYKDAECLPDPSERKLYIDELHHVGGLIAYPVPENSPTAVYLSQERREAVADQIEAAILYRTGQTPVSKPELSTRYTQVLWTLLHELKVKAPPRSNWPPGVASLPGFKSLAQSDGTKAAGGEAAPTKKPPPDSEAEILPEFDLHAFLDAPPS